MERTGTDVNVTATVSAVPEDLAFELRVAVERMEALCHAAVDLASIVDNAADEKAQRLCNLVFIVNDEAQKAKDIATRLMRAHGVCACGTAVRS